MTADMWWVVVMAVVQEAGQEASEPSGGIGASIANGWEYIAIGAAWVFGFVSKAGADKLKTARRDEAKTAQELAIEQELRDFGNYYHTVRFTLPDSAIKPAEEIRDLIDIVMRDTHNVNQDRWDGAKTRFEEAIQKVQNTETASRLETYGKFIASADRVISLRLKKGQSLAPS